MATWVVVKNVLRRIWKDPRTLVLILLTPLLFILLYGYSFSSGRPTHLATIVVNQDNGLASVQTAEIGRVTLTMNLGEKLVQDLDPELFHVVKGTDAVGAETAVEQGLAWVGLVLPEYFSHAVVNEALYQGGPRSITYEGHTVQILPPERPTGPSATLFLDDSSPLVTQAVLHALNTALTKLLTEQQAVPQPSDPFAVHLLYGGQVTGLDYTAPGVVGFAMTLITIMLTVISIVRERTNGTLTRILIGPVHPWEVTIGYALALTLVSFLQMGELFLVSRFLFNIRFVGSPFLVAVVVLVYAIGLQAMATLLSTVARNEFQAMQFILVILIPSIMISGVFWPIEAMPPGIRPIVWFSPLTYANLALREIMLRGRGIADIAWQLGALSGFAIVMLVFAIRSMRHQGYTA